MSCSFSPLCLLSARSVYVNLEKIGFALSKLLCVPPLVDNPHKPEWHHLGEPGREGLVLGGEEVASVGVRVTSDNLDNLLTSWDADVFRHFFWIITLCFWSCNFSVWIFLSLADPVAKNTVDHSGTAKVWGASYEGGDVMCLFGHVLNLMFPSVVLGQPSSAEYFRFVRGLVCNSKKWSPLMCMTDEEGPINIH